MEGPLGPATQLLAEIRYELERLADGASYREVEQPPAPIIEVLPAPVIIEGKEGTLDLSPLIEALSNIQPTADSTPALLGVLSELQALRKDIKAERDEGRKARESSTLLGGASQVMTIDTTAGPVKVDDHFTQLEVLADQAGSGSVLNFTFTDTTPKLIWVSSRGAASRALTSGTPTASFGIYCDDGVPQPISVESSTLSVYAPAASTVTVWGYS